MEQKTEKDIFNRLHLDGKNLAFKTIQNKIEHFISAGIYNDLEDFISDNPDLSTFQNHTKLNNTLRKVWGYQITDQEYEEILEVLRKKVAAQKEIKTENIQTVQAKGKELATYETENGMMVLDNSYAEKTIEQQLPELQQQHKQFQVEGEKNTEAMMNFMKEEIKPEVEFVDISSLNKDNLSAEEEKNLVVATQFQAQNDTPIQVNLRDGLILQDGNIKTIEERQNEIGVYNAKTTQTEETKEDGSGEKPKVRTLQMFKQAGFSNALILAFITGVFLGFIFLNSYIRVILP